MKVPFARSYWVVEKKLLAGAYPGSPDVEESRQKMNALFEAGIRCIVNLMEDDEFDRQGAKFLPYEEIFQQIAVQSAARVKCFRFPIQDLGIPGNVQMNEILNTIDDSVRRDQPVFVHCWGGKGRTGTVVGCYLSRHLLAEGQEALARIQILRKKDPLAHQASPETEKQRNMVRLWGKV
ncbi:MAG: dual specificity protein phosphatase family protein [SAR324 cluster bacterium]|nr:dual specificity protein phosphatase family protein [SAR324 cluster bacterium]